MRNALIIGLVLVAAFLANHWLSKETTPKVEDVKSEEKGDQKLARLYAQPRKPVAELIAKKTDTVAESTRIEPGCVKLWDNLRNLSLDSLDGIESSSELPESKECAAPPAPIAAVQKAYQDFCAQLDSPEAKTMTPDQLKQIQIGCQVAILRYRGTVTDFLTQGENLQEITDQAVLADKLLAKLLELPAQEGATPDFAGTAAVSDRLLELNPDLTPLTKISAGSQFVQTLPKSENEEPLAADHEQWSKSDAAIARAREADPDNPELEDVELWSKTRGLKLDRLKSVLDQMPEGSPTQQYYAAYFDWENGNREAALSSLKEGLQKYPNDPRFQAAQAFAQSGDPNNKFPIRINMDVDLERTLKQIHD